MIDGCHRCEVGVYEVTPENPTIVWSNVEFEQKVWPNVYAMFLEHGYKKRDFILLWYSLGNPDKEYLGILYEGMLQCDNCAYPKPPITNPEVA